jgi:glycosyltransferase involved in cell wall biosynthesis
MKIFYLSDACFADCEINLLKALGNDNEIIYAVVLHKNDSNYTVEELQIAFKDSRVVLRQIKLKYRLRDPRQIFTYYKLIKFILKNKADVVYVNNWGDLYLNFIASFFLKGRNTIIGIHDAIYHSGAKLAFIFNFSNKVFFRKFNTILTFSKSQAALLKSRYPKKSILTIPLALKDFGPKVKRAKDDGIIRFLFFGYILPYKGLDTLLKATNQLSTKYKNFKLIIAGRCPEWEELYEPLVKNQNYIEKEIRFIENKEIPYFFSNANYLLLPYNDVTQSGPLMIAYNYDLPVIASDINGFKEFIQNSGTGYLFEVGDELSLYNLLEDAVLRNRAEYDILVQNIFELKSNDLSFDVTLRKYREMFNMFT